ncbi:unnamed protein product [Phytomonas sp. Hart1]|nr:unnamed protein product [Phytomonas sp. Hart1]|eukprot:CCW70747.1 unnamed protein product [Phytomonas sp. isolate Hart1]
MLKSARTGGRAVDHLHLVPVCAEDLQCGDSPSLLLIPSRAARKGPDEVGQKLRRPVGDHRPHGIPRVERDLARRVHPRRLAIPIKKLHKWEKNLNGGWEIAKEGPKRPPVAQERNAAAFCI